MNHSILKKLTAILLAAVLCLGLLPAGALAEGEGEAQESGPAHGKSVESNGDGSFKLELSVTGDADTTVEKASAVNVVIVYDTSNSMTNAAEGSTGTRAENTERVVHGLIEGLEGYQDQNDKSNIEIALVTFGPNASITEGWTSDLSDDGINGYFDGTYTGFGYSGNLGTNWEWALIQAQNLLNQLDARTTPDNDPTYVIFITDGVCTKSGTANGNGEAPTNQRWSHYSHYYEDAADDAFAIEQRPDTTLFGIYAYGSEADLLDDLIYFANTPNEDDNTTGTHRTMTVGSSTRSIMDISDSGDDYETYDFGDTTDTDNHFLASDTDALNLAIDTIFEAIVEALGVKDVAMSDGTTNNVKTSTGTAELLEVDEGSFQYWLSIPLDANKQFTRVNLVSGDTEIYTVSDNGDGSFTVTWASQSVTVNGELVEGADGSQQLKYEWEKNALYNYDPPTAILNKTGDNVGAVDWDLSDVGTLLDGVTYSVSFDVYPSQEALDIVADIMNDPYVDENNQGAWGRLDPSIRKYISKTGELSTNTTATLTYTDSRDGSSGSATFVNPDPVTSDSVKQMAVAKEWENILDKASATPVTIYVYSSEDDTDPYEIALPNKDGEWNGSVYIAIGIMGKDENGNPAPRPGAEGHDYTFKEPKDISYHWELNIPTVHPMLIGDKVVMLIKVDKQHPLPEGATEYTIGTSTYYADDSMVGLTATNERRSSVNLIKVVKGDAPEDAVFPFTLKVKNSLAPDEEPTDDPKHESDYWVWISVRDKDKKPVNEGVTGATPENGTNGWYYAPSNTPINIDVKAGYSIRVNNVPTGTTYEITEAEKLPSGFEFTSAAIAVTKGEGDTEDFEGGRITTGTIESTNAEYTVTYTNTYGLGALEVTKVFEGLDADTVPTDFSISVYEAGDDTTKTVCPALTIDGADEVSESDGSVTYVWTVYGLTPDTKVSVAESGAEVEGYTYSLDQDTNVYQIEMGKKAEAKLTNTYTIAPGSLTIEKTFKDIAEAAIAMIEDLSFTVTGPDGFEEVIPWSEFVDGSYTLKDLIPGDYTVTESVSVGDTVGDETVGIYELTSDSKTTDTQTVVADGTVKAVIENVYKLLPEVTGTVTITKSATGATVPANTSFSIIGPEKFGEGGKMTVWYYQFDNDTYVIENAPAGDYTVTEDQASAKVAGYTLTTGGDNGTPMTLDKDNTEVQIAITNTYKQDNNNDNPPGKPTPPALNSEDHFYYVEGYPDGLVHPQGNITRAETATMIYRLLTAERRDAIFTDQSSFSDMDKSLWYNKAVSSMAKGEYIDGYPDGTFKGNNSITRAEFVTIVARFLENKATGENPFDDINGHWAKDYILAAVEAGWVDGYPDVTFKPDQPITRAEAMKIINSVLNRGVNETSKLGNFFNFPDNEDTSAWYYYEVLEAINDHEYTGKRPNENWTRNAVDYVYDIEKYERP